MSNLTINRDNAIKAYNSADASQRKLLETLFGADTFKSLDITERIKTFKDAYECIENNIHDAFTVEQAEMLEQYDAIINDFTDDKDLLTYLKLRIITTALNEGWEPKFTEDEQRWYPWFEFFTKSELNNMSDEQRGRVVGRAYHNSNANGGLAFANAYNASSGSNVYHGSRLAFKTRKLAEYAGRQFVALYADFVFPEKA